MVDEYLGGAGRTFDGEQIAIVVDVAEPSPVRAPRKAVRGTGSLLLAVDLFRSDRLGQVGRQGQERRTERKHQEQPNQSQEWLQRLAPGGEL